jgi:DNA-binding NarL/FixJ family response regulator
MTRTRVLLADDHALVAEGISRLLAERYELVGAARDGDELVDLARRLQPDLVVTDVAMPGLSGLEALRRLRAEGSDARFVFLTMHADPQLADEAFRAGASGFVLKHCAGEELVGAIDEVVRGGTYKTPRLARDDDAAPRLTPRQRQVLRLVADGKPMKEIAASLGVSLRTVETHKYEMMRVLRVQSNAELVRWAVRHGITEA